MRKNFVIRYSLFVIGICLSLFTFHFLLFISSWPAFAQCVYPNAPDPRGCCDYGEYTENQYYIPYSSACSSQCHAETYSGNFPYGGDCKYCSANICKRNDGQGGCTGICNWACCYYGKQPTTTSGSFACAPKEWLCKTEDTQLPDVLCCWWQCLPKEILPPHECPTNHDWGQKDGTGQTGDDRRYFYYDYDLEKTIEVPPAMPAQITPTPGPSPTCNPPSGWPAGAGRVTLTYRACHPTEGCHSGIDIVTSENKSVYSTLSGKVAFAGDSGGYGKTVLVECGGWEYAVGFSHLNSIRVQVGQKVTAGTTIIGTEGRTGRLTGSHVHYRVWKDGNLVDPAPFIPYRGCVDWTENNLGGGFCPGSGCTPECPNTPACGKARQQGQCAIATSLQRTFVAVVLKIRQVFSVVFGLINLG